MSTRYEHGERVPTEVLADRLDELANAVVARMQGDPDRSARKLPRRLSYSGAADTNQWRKQEARNDGVGRNRGRKRRITDSSLAAGPARRGVIDEIGR